MSIFIGASAAPKEGKMQNKVHWSFWVVVALALVWNLMGAINFLVQMNPDMVASYRESERTIIEGRPIWATGAFATGVFGGLIGSVLLLLRQRYTVYVFGVSLAGVIGAQLHTLGIGIDFGVDEIVGIVVSPIVVGIFLIWFAAKAKL